MPGMLRCNRIRISDKSVAHRVLNVLCELAREQSAIYRLEVTDTYYFSIPARRPPTKPGWYIICDSSRRPLYVGKASNLNYRLNDQEGTLDNFAARRRTSDPARNFIKALSSAGFLGPLSVIVISEAKFLVCMGRKGALSEIDRGNIEKFLNIFRSSVVNDAGVEPI